MVRIDRINLKDFLIRIINIKLIKKPMKISFAIIGGGPSGFYIAKCLSKLPFEPIIHIIEK
jgi:ribulose 1,5-bisphosphate synthetase/thiazole synthase